jgi:aminomethyltransferase
MILRSPLNNIHERLNAKFTDFVGFRMPIFYSSIKNEHITVRKKVGLFDVSHMSNIWISGEDAEKLISHTTLEDASKIKNGMSQYTAILREDGTIIDDVIFMNLDNEYMMIPNAGMSEKISKWLKLKSDENNLDTKIDDVSKEYTILAVQGPDSRKTLQKLTKTDLNNIGFFGCSYIVIDGIDCIISHTGYTGELGFELQINNKKNPELLFTQILSAGEEYGIKPIGLGARDTLRLEKCFLLAGNEFKDGRTPLEALLNWAINWDHEFIGKESLIKQKEEGNYERLTNLICLDKAIPRNGCKILKDKSEVGIVSSGTLSPCLNKGIAMAYVKPEFRNIDNILDIKIRNKIIKAKVVKSPFVKKDWAKL